MAKINIKEEIDKGALYSRVIFEIFGKPKENVEKALKLLVQKLRELEKVKVVVEKQFEPEKKDEMWAGFTEVELLVKDSTTFINLVVDYLPASVEIIEPQDISLPALEMSGMLNDLSVKLIDMNLEYQKSRVKADLVMKKLNTLISINLLRSLREKPSTVKELSDELRIEQEDLKPFLKDLVNTQRIEEKEGKYSVKNGT